MRSMPLLDNESDEENEDGVTEEESPAVAGGSGDGGDGGSSGGGSGGSGGSGGGGDGSGAGFFGSLIAELGRLAGMTNGAGAAVKLAAAGEERHRLERAALEAGAYTRPLFSST